VDLVGLLSATNAVEKVTFHVNVLKAGETSASTAIRKVTFRETVRQKGSSLALTAMKTDTFQETAPTGLGVVVVAAAAEVVEVSCKK